MVKFKLKINLSTIIIFLFFIGSNSYAQDDLLDELENQTEISKKVNNTFEALKIVNLESTKLIGKNDLYFVIAQRFGSIKNGFDDLFGLDEATIRFSFFTDFLMVLIWVSRAANLEKHTR